MDAGPTRRPHTGDAAADRGSSRSERRTAALAGEGDGDDKVRGGSDEEEADVAADGAKRPDLGQGAHRGSIPGDGEDHRRRAELHGVLQSWREREIDERERGKQRLITSTLANWQSYNFFYL